MAVIGLKSMTRYMIALGISGGVSFLAVYFYDLTLL
jgi:hypothetical protein